MRTIFLISLVTLALNSTASKQDSLVNLIFNLAYNMNYEQAEILLNENKNNIDEFYFAVLEIDMSYWENVTGTDNTNHKAFETTLKKYSIEEAVNFNQKGIQLIELSYQLRYELKRFKLFSAISTHKKTKLLFDEIKQDPRIQTSANPELFELYNSMFLYFSNYLKPFGGKSADKKCQQAIDTMKTLANSDRLMTKTLASYILGRTYIKYENKPERGIPYFQFLSDYFPGNTKFPELLIECQNKTN